MGGPVSSTYFRQKTQHQPTYGGILLRSLRRQDGKVISGPSLLVDEILRVCNAASIKELIDDKFGNDLSAFGRAGLLSSARSRKMAFLVRLRSTCCDQGKASFDKSSIYSSPRIGLDLSHPGTTTSPNDPRVVFVQKAYRFFTEPNILTANGRAQTFLGLYMESTRKGGNKENVLNEVMRLSGLKRSVVNKYQADYKGGMQNRTLKPFVGISGKGLSSSPAGYLKMMGALSAQR